MVDKDRLMSCKTKINDIKVIYEDGTTDTIPPMNIPFISIEKNFFYDFFPVFSIKILLDYKMYKKINNTKCKFSIDLKKFFIKSLDTNYNKKSIMTKNFINDIFININNGDASPDLYDNLKNNSDPTEFEKSQITMDLYLFQESAMDYTKLSNNVFKTCTVTDAILALASVTGQRPLLMTYPNNKSTYSNIIIPNNLTFLGCIDFIQSVYGIYNNGYCLFSDFDALYLIDKLPNCTAYTKNETKNVYITFTDKTQESGNIYGCYEDISTRCYIINCTSVPIISMSTDSKKHILPDNVNTVNTSTNYTNIESMKNTKIIDNKYANNYALDTYKYEKALCTSFTVDFKECDLDMFKINKEYNIKFDVNSSTANYKNSEGLYKLMAIQGVYEKKDDEIFDNTIRAKFIRV